MSCTTDVCGTGDWSGPRPGDPDNNAVLSANGVFGGIEVSWTYPNTNSHAVAHTLLYRSIGDRFETAIQVAIVSGNQYFDRNTTDPIRTYYYWIRFVSINGTLMEPIGPATGYALDDLDRVIEGMTGKIEAGALATSLRSRIDKISELESGITNLSQTITDETSILSQTLQGVQSDIDDALAYYEEEREARLLADGALASAINTTVAQAKDDLYAAIEVGSGTQAKINGDLQAQYSVKVDLAGNVAGFGLASSGNVYDGTIHSEFGVQADSFWVAGPTVVSTTAPLTNLYHGKVWVDDSNSENPVTKYYNKTTGLWQTNVIKGVVPFIVKTSEDPDTGAPPGVYIDSAYISKITANQIDSRGLSIKDASGNVILAAGNALNWSMVGGTGKPADGATVGAPSGTYVGGVLAQNVESQSGAQARADAAANWAASTAQTYAAAQANLAKINAQAYADGIVTAEEQRAINDAAAKAEAARVAAVTAAAADATTKANAAKTAAETYAAAQAALAKTQSQAYADGKVTAEETRAIADATAKAEAAKTAAINAAAIDATNKVASKLDKASSSILSIDSSSAVRMAGIRAGDLTWDGSGNRTSGKGVAITPSGILGHNGTKSTFSINATTGDATFGGTLSVASATSGERMEITNSVIKVYDAAGVLRVKLGNLAL